MNWIELQMIGFAEDVIGTASTSMGTQGYTLLNVCLLQLLNIPAL